MITSFARNLMLNANGLPEVHNVTTFKVVQNYLGMLDGEYHAWIQLIDQFGTYVQCVGRQRKLVIEYRVQGRFGYRHSVVRKERKLSGKFGTVRCSIPEVIVRSNEILSTRDAKRIFARFLETAEVGNGFYFRDITQLMRLGEAKAELMSILTTRRRQLQ